MTVDVEATMPRPGGHDAEESGPAKLDLGRRSSATRKSRSSDQARHAFGVGLRQQSRSRHAPRFARQTDRRNLAIAAR